MHWLVFYVYEPPKSDWQGKWKLKNEMGKEILVDSNWECIYMRLKMRLLIFIRVNGIDDDDNIIDTAIDIALTGYLGEETFMRLIKNIK